MCGRFTLTVTENQLKDRYDGAELTFDYQPRYNISPTQMIAAVIENQGQKKIGQLRWGLIPFWAKDEKIGYNTINVKAETVSEKPAFKSSFIRRRCIIPADGFYEWRKLSAKDKNHSES